MSETLKRIKAPADFKPGVLLFAATHGEKSVLFDRTEDPEAPAYAELNEVEEAAFLADGFIVEDANQRETAKVEKQTVVEADAPPAAIIDGQPAGEVLEPVKGKKK